MSEDSYKAPPKKFISQEQAGSAFKKEEEIDHIFSRLRAMIHYFSDENYEGPVENFLLVNESITAINKLKSYSKNELAIIINQPMNLGNNIIAKKVNEEKLFDIDSLAALKANSTSKNTDSDKIFFETNLYNNKRGWIGKVSDLLESTLHNTFEALSEAIDAYPFKQPGDEKIPDRLKDLFHTGIVVSLKFCPN